MNGINSRAALISFSLRENLFLKIKYNAIGITTATSIKESGLVRIDIASTIEIVKLRQLVHLSPAIELSNKYAELTKRQHWS